MANKKQKTKIVYKNPPLISEGEGNKIKEDIRELEARRATLPGGFKGFLAKAAITKQISEKRSYFSAKDKLRAIKAKTEYGKALIDHEKVKVELKELKAKSSVNFNDLYKQSGIYG